MYKFINKKTVLFLIIIIAVVLRFYQLESNPPSLTWDEASWGYNAYSLGIDGRDEFGRFLPYDYLESFGDYKPPMYAYLDVVPVKLLGLNEFSTRFPSAFFGTLTVFLVYFLMKRIFYNSKQKESYALLTSLFLAISPWHIMLSRAAFEANVATCFIITGVWAFLSGIQGKKWFILVSAISFALSFYTFNTARIVSPLLVFILFFFFRKKLLSIKKETILAILVGLAILIPIVPFLLSPQAGLRFKEVNIFSDSSIVKTANQEIENDNNVVWSKIIHNRRVLYGLEYVRHYFDNLNPSFLFIKGDGNPKFSTQNVGEMYLWDIVFFTAGVFLIFRKKEGYWWIVPLWLAIGIIPAATARETPHALRIETTLPTFQIITAYGFVQLVNLLKRYRNAIVGILIFLLFLNFFYFFHDYLYNYPSDFSGEWQHGYKQSIDYIKSVQNKYDYIQMTNALGRPYIYYLFYIKTDPDYFRKTSIIKRDSFGFVKVENFDKYIFSNSFDYNLRKTKKVLYINTPDSLPKNISILKTFYLLNGQTALVAYTHD